MRLHTARGAFVAGLFLASQSGYAQVSTATISGLIEEPTASAVAL